MARQAARRRQLRVVVAVGAALAAATAALQAVAAFLPAPARGLSAAQGARVAAGAAGADVAQAGRRGLAAGGIAGLAAAAPVALAQDGDAQVATFQVDLEGDDNGKGEIKVRLRPDWAPRGVRRFQELVRMGEFEEAAVFHVDDGRAHFGLPAEPTLEPARIKDDTVRQKNSRGTLTFLQGPMAHQRVNQMFFNREDNHDLDKFGYAPIGEVIEGMELVDRFYDGYGKQPKKQMIHVKGNAYLDEEFPKLSKIKRVSL